MNNRTVKSSWCTRWLFCIGILSSSAYAQQSAPDSAGNVDLTRFLGEWHEQARMPEFFQRGCRKTLTEYQLDAVSQLDITHHCRTSSGETKLLTAKAWPQEEQSSDRFWMRTSGWISKVAPVWSKTEYWILYVDPNYQYSLLGDSERKHLWLLSRREHINASTREALLMVARDKGYNVDRLLWRD